MPCQGINVEAVFKIRYKYFLIKLDIKLDGGLRAADGLAKNSFPIDISTLMVIISTCLPSPDISQMRSRPRLPFEP
jgi:hypothetical protein